MSAFTVDWTDADFAPFHEKLRAARIPDAVKGADPWRYGCNPAFLRELCAYWADGFDLAGCVADLNRFPQVREEVEGLDIHAVHLVGEAQGRRPLLLIHGWPGSIYEFWQAAEPLAFPTRYGGRKEDAFDLVIPSLPGFGFSGKPEGLVGARTTARLFTTLMREKLGYDRYLVQGGDWGAGVGAWMALEHAEGVRGLHLNMILTHPQTEPQTDEEKEWKARFDEAEQALGAYSKLQGTKPQSIGAALHHEPVGLAAWIVERFHDWSDLRERPFEQVFNRDQLITNLMIYLMNDAYPTSARYYAAATAEAVRDIPEGRRVEVPTAMASCPDPRDPPPPRSWAERGYDIRRWTRFERGGHFAAMEVPDLFVEDVRAFARDLPA